MSRAIRQLVARKNLTPGLLTQFLREHEFPIIEEHTATFAFVGEAEAVSLRHWIHGLPASQPFKRLMGSPLWYHVMDVPEGSRIEYKIEVTQRGQSRWVIDPLNPHQARDPYGANSVLLGPRYEHPTWAEADKEARTGSIETHRIDSKHLDGNREFRVYLPARFRRRRRYPLLVVHDGDDYLRFSNLQTVLDNLIHRLEIPSMIVALTNPVGRLTEYAAGRAHAAFVAKELVPWLEDTYPLLEDPAQRGLMGASFGAVQTLATALYQPGVFGNLLLQSGSFAFSDIGKHWRGPAFEPVVKFMNGYRATPKKPAPRAFVSCGMYESLIYENRSMVPLFERTGLNVRYVESRDGHNWENWRDRLREGLSWLFPGPSLLVYE